MVLTLWYGGWFAGTMASKDKQAIQGFQRELVDESSETDQSEGFVEVHRFWIDLRQMCLKLEPYYTGPSKSW